MYVRYATQANVNSHKHTSLYIYMLHIHFSLYIYIIFILIVKNLYAERTKHPKIQSNHPDSKERNEFRISYINCKEIVIIHIKT